MDAIRWRQLQDLFETARSLDDDRRERLLQSQAARDADLADRLRALLDADAHTGVIDALAPRFVSLGRLLDDSRPDRIGAYRVVREVGRGGMGIVYLAERVDGDFEQRVAVKLINGVYHDSRLHRRFLNERRILAGLQHPGIARLLDGGMTGDGRPYLVMEYVDGLTLTDYADLHRLDVRGRLRLFLEVCAAVQHAHQNLVIHRDLKPANILVSDDGRVHLLDFGIATLIDPAFDGEGHPPTRFDSQIMTPQYASPEQLRGESLTTASDIYALGVLLYELVCGVSPYRLEPGSAAGIARLIGEQDPERPSARVRRVPHAAASRGTSSEHLARQLRGDLDGIVMMALRKEPQRRYASADMLRQDLERYLAGQPVIAHRGSRRYRAGKFLRRHRTETAAGVIVMLTLVAGLVMAAWQGRTTARERDRAELALAESTGVTTFLIELFQSGDQGRESLSSGLAAIDLLNRGARRADQLAGQPLVHARLLDAVGQMFFHLGRLDEAQQKLERAVTIRRTTPGASGMDLAGSLIHLSWIHRARRDYDRARPLLAEAIEIRRRLLPAGHPDIGEALHELGRVTFGTEQERLFREALDHLGAMPPTAERRISVLHMLSTNLRRQGRLADAVAVNREALAEAERQFGPEHHVTGHAMIFLGDHVRDIERDAAAAEQFFRRGLELLTRHYGDHSVRLIHGLNSLAQLSSDRDQDSAEALYRRALTIAASATGPDHPRVAEQLHLLAAELARQQRAVEAEPLARRALELTIETVGARHQTVATRRLPLVARVLDEQRRHTEADLTYRRAFDDTEPGDVMAGEMHRDYGLMLLRRGDHARAEQQLLQSLARLERGYGGRAHPNVDETKRALMSLYRRMNRPDSVEQYRVAPGRFVAY